jgi:MFS family permease
MPKSRENKSSRLVIQSAVVIAIAIMGDALMYSLLPLEAESLGIPLTAVGLLLSINRFVRLGTNTWAGIIIEKFGPRTPFILASVLALITTAIYGLGWGLVAFFVARAGWGLAWSVFRQGGYQAVWEGKSSERGKLMGFLWGIVLMGSAISVLIGGWLYDQYGYSTAVFVIVGLSTIALPLALRIDWPIVKANKTYQRPKAKFSFADKEKGKSQKWLLAAGFTETFFDGILISTASLFLARQYLSELNNWPFSIGTLAGLLLAIRFSANIIFGPLIGALSDRIGQRSSMSLLSGLILLGVSLSLILPAAWLPLSISLIFIASSGFFVSASASASAEGSSSERPHIFVSLFNTSVDTGAAFGPLFAFSSPVILNSIEIVYFLAAALLFLVVQIYARIAK